MLEYRGYSMKWRLQKTKREISKSNSEYNLWRIKRTKTELLVGKLILDKEELRDLKERLRN